MRKDIKLYSENGLLSLVNSSNQPDLVTIEKEGWESERISLSVEQLLELKEMIVEMLETKNKRDW